MVHNKCATNWSRPTDTQTAYKRAGGRRGYNARRQFAAAERRYQIMALLDRWHITPIRQRGVFARLAEALHVHRSTISRDWHRLIGDTIRARERYGGEGGDDDEST